MQIKTLIKKTTDNARSRINKVSATVKLYSKKNELNEELNSMFDTLGKMYYYGAVGDGPDTEGMKCVVEGITELKLRITEVEEEIRALSGKKICPNCSSELQKNISYCPHCGARITEAPQEDEAQEEQTEIHRSLSDD